MRMNGMNENEWNDRNDRNDQAGKGNHVGHAEEVLRERNIILSPDVLLKQAHLRDERKRHLLHLKGLKDALLPHAAERALDLQVSRENSLVNSLARESKYKSTSDFFLHHKMMPAVSFRGRYSERQWRLVKWQVGYFRAIDHQIGISCVTDGITLIIESASEYLFYGHLENFIPVEEDVEDDESELDSNAKERRSKSKSKINSLLADLF